MAIFKQSPKKIIRIGPTIFWGLIGFFGGVYTFQPFLKAFHREERSILTEYIKIEDGKVVHIERPGRK